jgi:alpha-1,6-mannosyltransferase
MMDLRVRVILLSFIGAALLGLAAAGLAVLVPGMLPLDDDARVVGFMVSICVAGLLWLAAVSLVRGQRLPRNTIWLVLVVAMAMRVMSLASPPVLSSDIYRYVWDGRVQLAGINPYRYLPVAPELALLRDQAVYPHINRADYAHTMYQPAAQAIFAMAAAVTPGVFGMKLMMALFDALAIGALIALLRIAGRDPAELLIYAWLPLPIWEFAGNAHIDAAAAGLLALAFLLAVWGRSVWTGVLLAAATLTKFLPVAVLPAFWRPRDWRLLTAFAVAIVALYLLYATAGWQLFGFFNGYAGEEGFRSGRGFFVLQVLDSVTTVPAWATELYVGLALAVLGLVAACFAFGPPLPAAPGARVLVQARQATILAAGVLVVVSPHYPWYFGWLAPLACLAPLPSVLWMLAACPLLAHGSFEYLIVPAAVYVPAAILAVFDLRRGRTHDMTLPQTAIGSAR